MKAVFSKVQLEHDPQFFMHKGKVVPHPEQPERAKRLLQGVEKANCDLVEPSAFGDEHILAIHPERYISFLKEAHDYWEQLQGAAPEIVPNIHPVEVPATYPDNFVGRSGWHQTDLACPIGERTWAAARSAADCALTVAHMVKTVEVSAAYALCRPPGHHAYTERAGGFCFLGNSAIAAQYLLQAHQKVAIVDVDVHHGNGTQGIFYRRGEVLTCSVHADPMDYYPFYWGHSAEAGEGEGEGANLNLPVPVRSDDEVWLAAVDRACEAVAAFGATALVVALGLDAHEKDPLLGGAVTTEGFSQISARLAALSLPTAIIQEGGYLTDHLGDNLASFLGGFEAAHRVAA
ncbi:MAG: histone deacetylase family protein [Pseudomonadota bacterium]